MRQSGFTRLWLIFRDVVSDNADTAGPDTAGPDTAGPVSGQNGHNTHTVSDSGYRV